MTKKQTHTPTAKPKPVQAVAHSTAKPRTALEETHRYCTLCGKEMAFVVEHAPSTFNRLTGAEILGAKSRFWQCIDWTPEHDTHDREVIL